MQARGLWRAALCLALTLVGATFASGCSGDKRTFFGGSSQTPAAPIVESGFVPVGAAVATQNTSGTLQLAFSTSLLPTGSTSANIVVLFLPKGGSTIVQLTPASVDNSQDVVTVNVTAAGTYQPEVQIHADQARSSVIASSGGLVADGKTPVTITVFAKDADGVPVGSDTVTLAATGAPSGVTITQPGTTDATGATSGSVTSTFAGPITITATITGNGGPTVTLTTVVTFVAGALDVNVSKVSSGFGSALANGFSAIPINVTTTDAFGNPISGLTVTIAASGSFMTTNQPSAPTDVLGKTSGSVASSFPQGSTVTATVQGSNALQLSNQAQISFVLVPHYLIVSQNQSNGGGGGTSLSGKPSPPAGVGARAPAAISTGSPSPSASPGLASALAVFKVDPTNGNLTLAQSPTPTDDEPDAVAIEPRQHFVYTGCNNSGNFTNGGPTGSICAFKLSDADGSLTPVTGSPFTMPAPDPSGSTSLSPHMDEIAITPNGQFLYVADPVQPASGNAAGLYGFQIDSSTGAIHFIQRTIPTVAGGQAGVQSLVVDPRGKFLYVSTASPGDGSITAPMITRFSIDSRLGLLTEVGTTVANGGVAAIGFLAMDPLGRFLYASDINAGDFYLFGIDPVSGERTELDEKESSTKGDNIGQFPQTPAPDPFGRFVYVPSNDGDFSSYALGFLTGGNLDTLQDGGGSSGFLETTLALPGGLVFKTDSSGNGIDLFTTDSTGSAAANGFVVAVQGLASPVGLAVSYGVSRLP